MGIELYLMGLSSMIIPPNTHGLTYEISDDPAQRKPTQIKWHIM